MERKSTHSTNRDGLLLSESMSADTTSSDFVLQWGNRKRLRCMKVQGKGGHSINDNNDPTRSGAVQRATTRMDSRVVIRSRAVRSDHNYKDPVTNQQNTNRSNGGGNGYLNLRQRPASPSHRTFRNNPESSIGMRGNINGVRRLASPDGGDKKGTNTAGTNNNISNNDINNNNNQQHRNNKNNNKNSNSNHNNDNHHSSGGGGGSGSSEIAREGSSSGDGDTITAVWPPKFVIALTNKEKEEDFMAIKGSKLPQRPKKRAKFVQRTLNLVSPGAWLCDLTLERYEVREKKVIKKRPRGLKAMGNMDSDSE